MSTLTIDFITSLDGYGAGEGWPGWWGLEGPEYLDWLAGHPDADATVLLGAKTYTLMHGFSSQGEPGTDVMGAFDKIVFSNTLADPLAWENSRLVRGDAVDEVRKLKETATKPMRTVGSLTLARSLLAAGVADRFRVVVFPVVTGATGSERVYDGWPDVALELVEARTFDGRSQLLEYVPTVLEAPPLGRAG